MDHVNNCLSGAGVFSPLPNLLASFRPLSEGLIASSIWGNQTAPWCQFDKGSVKQEQPLSLSISFVLFPKKVHFPFLQTHSFFHVTSWKRISKLKHVVSTKNPQTSPTEYLEITKLFWFSRDPGEKIAQIHGRDSHRLVKKVLSWRA